jgi:hypothetical protein
MGLDYMNDVELLINSDNGILIKGVSMREFEFYDTGIRSLFQESIFLDFVFKDGVLYINVLNDDKESSTVVLHFGLGSEYKYISLDLYKSDNIQLKDIRKINFIERKYLKNIFIYHKRLLLDEGAYFIDEIPGGDFCKEADRLRKAVIEYRCDHGGNAESLVSLS